jgi:hypothetical protein
VVASLLPVAAGAETPTDEPAATLLLSSAPSRAAAEAKWSKLVKAVPGLASLPPLYASVGDPAKGGYVGLRVSGPRSRLVSLCKALAARRQFCALRGAPAAPGAIPTPVAPAPADPDKADDPDRIVTLLLSSAKSDAAAQAKWAKLVKAVPALGHLTPARVAIGDPARGGYVSLRVSGPQRKIANICVMLTAKGQYCYLHGVLEPIRASHPHR